MRCELGEVEAGSSRSFIESLRLVPLKPPNPTTKVWITNILYTTRDGVPIPEGRAYE